MVTMLGFRQFIVEMAGQKKAFDANANDAEGILVRHIVYGGSGASDETKNDNNRASRISKFIHKTIKEKFDTNYSPRTENSYDTGTSKKIAGETRKALKIHNFMAGRRIEDAVISSNNKHYLLDLKMSESHSNGSFPSLKTNKIYSGVDVSKDTKGKTVIKPRKNIVPDTHPIDQKNTLSEHIKSLHNHFESLDHNGKESIVKELMNSHEKTPENVKKLQVIDGVNGTKIYDSDETWKYFNDNFKPKSYSSEVIGNNKKIYAHNDNGDRIHICSVSVKHRRPSKGSQLDFNLKHHLADNLSQKYGYKPLAQLKH